MTNRLFCFLLLVLFCSVSSVAAQTPALNSGTCGQGFFWENAGCSTCPANPIALVIATTIILLVVVVLLSFQGKSGQEDGPDIGDLTVTVVQGINFMQFVSLSIQVPSMYYEWPAALRQIREIIKYFDFSFESFGLRCLLGYDGSFIVAMLVPLGLLSLFGLFGVGALGLGHCKALKKAMVVRVLGVVVRSCVTLLKIIFLPLTTKAIRLFDCSIGQVRVLEEYPQMLCGSEKWKSLIPYAAVAFFVYSAVPIALVIWVYWRSFKSKPGGILVVPFEVILGPYRKGYGIYELLIMTRKALVSILIFVVSHDPNGSTIFAFSYVLLFALVARSTLPFKSLRQNVGEIVTLAINSTILALSVSLISYPSIPILAVMGGLTVVGFMVVLCIAILDLKVKWARRHHKPSVPKMWKGCFATADGTFVGWPVEKLSDLLFDMTSDTPDSVPQIRKRLKRARLYCILTMLLAIMSFVAPFLEAFADNSVAGYGAGTPVPLLSCLLLLHAMMHNLNVCQAVNAHDLIPIGRSRLWRSAVLAFVGIIMTTIGCVGWISGTLEATIRGAVFNFSGGILTAAGAGVLLRNTAIIRRNVTDNWAEIVQRNGSVGLSVQTDGDAA